MSIANYQISAFPLSTLAPRPPSMCLLQDSPHAICPPRKHFVVIWVLLETASLITRTRAIPGPPMLINDFQGIPSLPEPVDDEFITSQGFFPQPANRTSVLAGFVAISNSFKIISECFFHHRCVLSNLRFITIDWTSEAEERLHKILRELPDAIQDPSHAGEGARQAFGMQRANVLITAAIAKFALVREVYSCTGLRTHHDTGVNVADEKYDLRAALNVDEEQLARERETIAREIHSLLMK